MKLSGVSPRVVRFHPSTTFLRRTLFALFILLMVSATTTLRADTVQVDDPNDVHHLVTGCSVTKAAPCGLWDAITFLNLTPGPHTITFSVTSVTLSGSLPQIARKMTIGNAALTPRVDIIGSAATSGFDIGTGGGGATPGTGTIIKNLVIRGMSGAGVSITDGGNTVQNCYIGTMANGSTAAPNAQGITITTTAIPVLYTTLPFVPTTTGNLITGNVISGNTNEGIVISGQNTILNIVTLNMIGTDSSGTSAVPNGSHGVNITGNAFANTIGPTNIISANSGLNTDGINLSGSVLVPNIVTLNIIGPSSDLVTGLGNGREGINITSTKLIPATPEVADIGPGNIIGYNKEDGIQITGSAGKVRVFGNFVGVASVNGLSPFLDLGNIRDGIHINTVGNQIGGATVADTNVISANHGSGIMLANNSAFDNVIQGNIIGRDPLTLAPLTSFGNLADGITISDSGSNTIGGTNSGEPNIVAGNKRDGIKITSAFSGGNGWANLITRNSIFGNDQGGTGGLGIDLDVVEEDIDPVLNTDTPNPNFNHSNLGQHAPVVLSGASAPTYNSGTGITTVNWTLETSVSVPVTVEFFASDAPPPAANHGEGQKYLGSFTVPDTGGTGVVALSTPVLPVPAYDTRGKYITMTATPTDSEAVPGPISPGPANNTSEFSNAVLVPTPGTLQFSQPVYTVGEAGGTATITVTRTGGSDNAVSVDFTTGDNTATQPSDYMTASGTLNWADGDSASKTFTVTIIDDTVFEGPESLNLTLSNAGGGAALGAQSSAALNITDNDTQPTISINDVALAEGNSGTTSFTFNVTLSNASTQTITVQYATAGVTATAGTDFVTGSGTVTFPPNSTSQPVTVLVNGDTTPEADETFVVNLTAPTNATILDNQGQGTIQNDDGVPTISINDVSHFEGNSGTTSYAFTVTLSAPSVSTVTVQFTTADQSATSASNDYQTLSGTVTFPPSSTSQPVTILVNGDTVNEPDETFFVNLSSPTNATILDGQGLGTILNDDPIPTISITDFSLSEGNSGTTPFGFNVTLSNPSSQTVTVQFTTADNTATTADADYASNSGTLTFPPLTTAQPVTVLVNGDNKNEPNESFFVNLSAPVNATILDGQGLGTIQNDDPIPTISITDVSQNEGNAGPTPFIFSVTLSNPSSQTVTVQYATADNTATTLNNDYVSGTGTVTFSPGVTSQPVTILVNGDVAIEPNETFFVNLATPVNATILDNQGLGTIQNDDSLTPTFTINNVTQVEGNAGASSFVFTVTLAPAPATTVTVQATTADGTATVADNDYASNTQTLTFTPVTSTQQFTVTVNGDNKFEPTETFAVNLSANSAGTAILGSGTGTITNDDTQPTIAITDVSQNEGNSLTTSFGFVVSLSNPSSQTITVQYATTDGTATTLNNDYVSGSGTITFLPGVISQPLAVVVNGDTTVEPNETFFVNLTAPVNATISDNQGLGSILNDDGVSLFTINSVVQNEGTSETTAFNFTVTLTPAALSTTTVQATTADGTATVADNDYVANSQTLTFTAGVTTQTFTVLVNGDTKFETNETFTVNLSANSAGTAISGPAGTGTITNDDGQPTIRITSVSAPEGNVGTTPFLFSVDLSNPSYQTITVNYGTADGSATIANSDYAASSGLVTFAPGSTSQPVTVLVNGDTTVEPAETFVVNLTTPVNATILTAQGTATIVNDDGVAIPAFGGHELLLLALFLSVVGAIAIRRH